MKRTAVRPTDADLILGGGSPFWRVGYLFGNGDLIILVAGLTVQVSYLESEA